ETDCDDDETTTAADRGVHRAVEEPAPCRRAPGLDAAHCAAPRVRSNYENHTMAVAVYGLFTHYRGRDPRWRHVHGPAREGPATQALATDARRHRQGERCQESLPSTSTKRSLTCAHLIRSSGSYLATPHCARCGSRKCCNSHSSARSPASTLI